MSSPTAKPCETTLINFVFVSRQITPLLFAFVAIRMQPTQQGKLAIDLSPFRFANVDDSTEKPWEAMLDAVHSMNKLLMNSTRKLEYFHLFTSIKKTFLTTYFRRFSCFVGSQHWGSVDKKPPRSPHSKDPLQTKKILSRSLLLAHFLKIQSFTLHKLRPMNKNPDNLMNQCATDVCFNRICKWNRAGKNTRTGLLMRSFEDNLEMIVGLARRATSRVRRKNTKFEFQKISLRFIHEK